jgi:predicted nucleic acid-binding protein
VIAIVDTGPLYAATDASDEDHRASVSVLQRSDLQLVIPALVVAEVTYLLEHRMGAIAEARFLRSLEAFDVRAPTPDDWPRIASLVEQYGDFPLGGTDASVVALAERLDTDLIITLDRRHFGAIRPRHRAAFRLLPD